jgi:hypothetical protein
MMTYVIALTFFCLVNGCDSVPHGGVTPHATTSASASPTTATHNPRPEPTYTMPTNLCSAISWEAFIEAYPDQPLRQMAEFGRKEDPGHVSEAACTAFVGKAEDGLFLTIEAKVYAQAASAHDQYMIWRNSDARRQSDIKNQDAIGSAAYSMSDRILGPALVVVHGNVLLRFSVRDLGTAGHIPLADPTQRLRRLATATIANLPQTRPTTTTWPPSGPQP